VQVFLALGIGEGDGLVGEIPVEAQINERVRELLTLIFVPRNAQWGNGGLYICEIVTISMFDTITDAEEGAVSFGKAEDTEIVNPLDGWRNVEMFPDIDGSIGYFALET
jgi:hypothetical protein